ncbi:MAG: hypothetical protein NTW29_02365 [Bacteroidetes bacterium]|nr:hypothetical protein [Bacteroidota bacterium]
MATLLVFQEYNSQVINKIRDKEVEINNRVRDSIFESRVKLAVDSNRFKLYEDISIAFGKQNMQLDTFKKEIHKLRDSSNRTIIIPVDKRPTIELLPPGPRLEIRDKKKILFISYTSMGAWAKIINMSTSFILVDTLNELYFLKSWQFPTNGREITEENIITNEIDLGDINLNSTKGFCIYLKGSYTDKFQSKIYTADLSYYFGHHTGKFTYATGNLRDRIIELLRRNLVL